MQPDSQRVRQVFDAALELTSPDDRAAYLERVCGDDHPLRREVEALLRNQAAADEFFENAQSGAPLSEAAVEEAAKTDRAIPCEEGIGSLIGRYKLREQIGEGGCGVVYVAEQEEPVRRRVALKVIKAGMDTRAVVARFEGERQALAMMDQPRIPDFNGDGKADLLLQRSDGILAAWCMDGSRRLSSRYLNPRQPGVGWKLVTSADFNGDQSQDLLLQHTNGTLAIWVMNGTNWVRNESLVPATSGSNWRAVSLGDFNSDGKLDLFFQHLDGALAVWLMNGGSMIESRYVNPPRPPDVNWKLVGVADVARNGIKDGMPDLVWQNQSTGQMGIWFMDGINLVESSYLVPDIPDSVRDRVVAVADHDGDGEVDLVFNNGSRLAFWYLNGIQLKQKVLTTLSPSGTSWQVVGPK